MWPLSGSCPASVLQRPFPPISPITLLASWRGQTPPCDHQLWPFSTGSCTVRCPACPETPGRQGHSYQAGDPGLPIPSFRAKFNYLLHRTACLLKPLCSGIHFDPSLGWQNFQSSRFSRASQVPYSPGSRMSAGICLVLCIWNTAGLSIKFLVMFYLLGR